MYDVTHISVSGAGGLEINSFQYGSSLEKTATRVLHCCQAQVKTVCISLSLFSAVAKHEAPLHTRDSSGGFARPNPQMPGNKKRASFKQLQGGYQVGKLFFKVCV